MAPGGSQSPRLPMNFGGAVSPPPASPTLQVAIKCNTGVFYLADSVPMEAATVPAAAMEQNAFLSVWRGLADKSTEVPCSASPADALAKLQGVNLALVAKRPGAAPGAEVLYMSGKVAPAPGADVLVEATVVPGHPTARICVRSQRDDLAPLVFTAAQKLLA